MDTNQGTTGSEENNPAQQSQCTPITNQMRCLNNRQIMELKTQAEGWQLTSDKGITTLKREFRFKDFKMAMQFAERVGSLAGMQGHYPRLTVIPKKVVVEWGTPVLGGLHPNDFIMAMRTNDLHSRWELISGQKDVVQEASEESFPASDSPSWRNSRRD
ncbi:MAG TPA: 4a-hydroxytetrahydrobiopterin dehydratase [Phototrophicaceae bacterium]|nr:4a-hydroxytetrahydrobiopterin dehydratase [Phototrophicaceae bacterium]